MLLLPLNILLESFKWKLLIDKLELVKMNKAFTAVLTGISVSMFLPNRVGDYLGRVFVLDHASHIKGILVTLIGSLAQILTTMIAGGLALIFVVPIVYDITMSPADLLYFGMVLLVLLLASFFVLLYFNVGLLKVISVNIFKKRKLLIESYSEVFALYKKRELFIVLMLSILRYSIFSFQFYLMLHVFDFELNYFDAMMLISLTYFVITTIPTIAITELGVRGSVAVSLFSIYFTGSQLWTDHAALSVIAASSAVWLINLALPAIFGAIFAYRLKFFRRTIDDK
ncbi:MAG: hypothetical protein CVT92_15945 [Bacteroidetes bacterium HGW-Bacteroidetes-1]|nr:MAG: hypothetical protein CVT92_15945 [Bacteroidetes bacterium HGW-Bacteroidetes-1]